MADTEISSQQTEGHWVVKEGKASERPDSDALTGKVEELTYNNPFNYEIEKVWFDGKVIFAIELGEIEGDVDQLDVAQEYQLVYDVTLGPDGKPTSEPEKVPGQYNIYDSVPGMDNYSPLWQFNFVVVPRDYRANRLRSEADCLDSGYPIHKSTVIEN